MRVRLLPLSGLVLAMVVTALVTYLGLAGESTTFHSRALKPTQTAPRAVAEDLHGSLYFVQAGAIYRLAGGRFQQLTQVQGWTQVSALPGGAGLLAVKRESAFSDVYRLDADGHVVTQLTHNAAGPRADIGANHWSFYPQATPDGQSVFMSYDSAKSLEYQVDLAIWEMPAGGARSQWRQWTAPKNYTGGDIQPLPLASGGLIYVGFDQDENGHKASQLWLLPRRFARPLALTKLADDCAEPALSPDGKTLAMVCTYEKESAQLVLADFDGSGLSGQRALPATPLLTEPTWAPDGSGIAYLAPAAANQAFQLWWLPRAAYAAGAPAPSPAASAAPAPARPIQVTSHLAIDATSAIGWIG